MAVRIDPDRMKQVFDNLISNSMKHTLPGGTFGIAITAEEARVHITLSDTGAGITEQDLPHIFDRFYQGNHAKPGMGLGLSIVKEIVRRHNGLVTVRRLQKGIAFTIQLPADDEPVA